MSVKIKMSYTEDEELKGIVRLLSPAIKSYKTQPPKGAYKRAYFVIKEGVFTPVLAKENVEKPAENKGK